MVFIVVFIILSFILFYGFDKSKKQGVKGEAKVARQLWRIQNESFRVFNDVLLRTKRGTTQIDHVVISVYGIFVIETKHHSGWIHGNEKSEYWTQTFYNTKNRFRNPIKQNWAHVYALKELLSDFRQVSYHPIVVFSGDAELKNISASTPVIYSQQLVDTIRSTRGMYSLSIREVASIASKLDDVTIKGKNAEKAHVYHIRSQVQERRLKERSLICPRCGGTLIMRNGKYSEFYGCSNYPKCRYTRAL